MKQFLKFGASWCGQCKVQDNILKNVHADIEYINVDEEEEMPNYLNIMTLPTILLMRNGVEERRFTGVTQADVLQEAYDTLEDNPIFNLEK